MVHGFSMRTFSTELDDSCGTDDMSSHYDEEHPRVLSQEEDWRCRAESNR